MAAEALSNMAQAGFPHLPPGVPQYHYSPAVPGMEPGPSSHPRGPPSLGTMTSASAAQPSPTEGGAQQGSRDEDPQSDDPDKQKPASGGRRTGRSATMTNDEWARQRKDNHVRPLTRPTHAPPL